MKSGAEQCHEKSSVQNTFTFMCPLNLTLGNYSLASKYWKISFFCISQKECGKITKVKTSYSENTLDSTEFPKPTLTTLQENLCAGLTRTITATVTCVRDVGKTKQQMNYAANKRHS